MIRYLPTIVLTLMSSAAMIRSPVDIFNGVPINEKDRSPKYLSYSISHKSSEPLLIKVL